MSAFGNRELILNKNELPIVNGRRINSIYACMETAYRTDQILHDCYNDKPDYYHLITDDSNYDKDGNWGKMSNIKTKTLPKELAELIGYVEVRGKRNLVTYISFRTSDSGHGGFIDDTIYFGKSFSYYRMKRPQWGENSVFKGDDFEKKILAVLGNKFTVEEAPEWFDKEYPHTPIRRIGTCWYPDYKLEGWRRSYDMPYVTNEYGKLDHIRVYYAPYHAHIYLRRVTEKIEVGEEGLIDVSFSRDYDRSRCFCCISGWNDSKEEDPNGIIRFKILEFDKNWGWKVAAMIGDKQQWTRTINGGFYKIQKISYIDK